MTSEDKLEEFKRYLDSLRDGDAEVVPDSDGDAEAVPDSSAADLIEEKAC